MPLPAEVFRRQSQALPQPSGAYSCLLYHGGPWHCKELHSLFTFSPLWAQKRPPRQAAASFLYFPSGPPRGSRAVKVEPSPKALSAWMVPPCAWTIHRTMESPRPLLSPLRAGSTW